MQRQKRTIINLKELKGESRLSRLRLPDYAKQRVEIAARRWRMIWRRFHPARGKGTSARVEKWTRPKRRGGVRRRRPRGTGSDGRTQKPARRDAIEKLKDVLLRDRVTLGLWSAVHANAGRCAEPVDSVASVRRQSPGEAASWILADVLASLRHAADICVGRRPAPRLAGHHGRCLRFGEGEVWQRMVELAGGQGPRSPSFRPPASIPCVRPLGPAKP